jgi:hypothetical protein
MRVSKAASFGSASTIKSVRAFSGKVDTGFPPENATNLKS